jgi:hypothetical protein
MKSLTVDRRPWMVQILASQNKNNHNKLYKILCKTMHLSCVSLWRLFKPFSSQEMRSEMYLGL